MAISAYALRSSPSWPSNRAHLETGADMVVHYTRSARATPALGTYAAAPSHVVNMLTDEQQYSRHADAAAVWYCSAVSCQPLSVRWCGTASELSYFAHSLPLSQPGSLQGLLVCVVGSMGCAVEIQENTVYSDKTAPFELCVGPSPTAANTLRTYFSLGGGD